MFAIFAIENLLGQLTDKCQEDQIKMKSSLSSDSLFNMVGTARSVRVVFANFLPEDPAGNGGIPNQLMTNKLTALKLISLLHARRRYIGPFL
jgi:hypothetical protein